MIMGIENLKKIKQLLVSGDLTNIILAFELGKSLVTDMHSFVEGNYGFLLRLFELKGNVQEQLAALFLLNNFTIQEGEITALRIPYRRLSELNKDISQLKTLKEFTLSDNRLRELPPEIGGLIHLEYLLLYNNNLTELPKETGRLKSLRTLRLFNNNLSVLPSETGQKYI